jgi:hypothetical protein
MVQVRSVPQMRSTLTTAAVMLAARYTQYVTPSSASKKVFLPDGRRAAGNADLAAAARALGADAEPMAERLERPPGARRPSSTPFEGVAAQRPRGNTQALRSLSRGDPFIGAWKVPLPLSAALYKRGTSARPAPGTVGTPPATDQSVAVVAHAFTEL